MRRLLFLVLFICLISPPIFHPVIAQDKPQTEPLTAQGIEKQPAGEFDANEIAAASSWIHATGIVDWLGPLAPLALSPFFGVTCLSGLSIWGPDWVTNNAVLGSAGPLKNETLFFAFLALTALTSVPRLTKVSKPFVQAIDRLETYAVIVILLVIKVVASMQTPDTQQVAMIQLGVLSVTADTLVAIAMVINVLVINSVKFFFEFMVWLTPIPFVDAIFEVCNKTVCAALMAVYAFSPTLATVINLIVLLVAAIVLRWISRRVRFYRTMVLDPVLAKLWTGFGQPKRPELIVFPNSDFGPFVAKSRLRMIRNATDIGGWTLTEANWWMPAKQHSLPGHVRPIVRHGWVMHSIEIAEAQGTSTVLSFSRRYDNESLHLLLQDLGMEPAQALDANQPKLATEFA